MGGKLDKINFQIWSSGIFLFVFQNAFEVEAHKNGPCSTSDTEVLLQGVELFPLIEINLFFELIFWPILPAHVINKFKWPY